MLENQVLPPGFGIALELGKINEKVITHEFEYQGIPVHRTQGKDDFDFYLPDGRSCEVKLDLRSQATNYAVLEEPTHHRKADIHIQTLTYALVLTRDQVERVYKDGKLVKIGQYQYPGRIIPKSIFKQNSMYLHEFIKSLKN